MRIMIKMLLIAVFVSIGTSAYAHPASDLALTFDGTTRMLTVTIKHQVSSPEKHFIDTANVSVNGREAIKHLVSRQDDNAGQMLAYLLPDVNAGDTIAVNVHCNKGGDLRREIKK